MSLSTTAAAEVQKESVGVTFVDLITVDHASLVTPFRLTTAGQPVTSRGNVFIPAVVKVAAMGQAPGKPPRLTVVLGFIDSSMTEAGLTVDDAPTMLHEIITLEEPDVVQITGSTLEFAKFTPGVLSAQIELKGPDLGEKLYPKSRMDPAIAPGLFT